MLTCRDAHALIVRTIDDASLSAAARVTLREHLSACAACREEYETQHEVRRLLALHVEEQPPAGFETRLHARLANVPRPTRRTMPALRRWAVRLLPIAATIAVIATDARLRDAAPSAPPLRVAPAAVAHRDIPLATPRHRQLTRLATAGSTSAPAAEAAPPPVDPAIIPELKLTETQRKQIAEITDQRRQTLQDILDSARKRAERERHQADAAIERVLTPEQRQQYRAAAATRAGMAAAQGWTLLPQAATIPPPAAPPPPQWPLPSDRVVPPFEP